MPCRIIVFSRRKGERSPRENPPNGHFFAFSRGDLSPRHTKVRNFSCFAFSPPVCRVFAWRGERSPRENTPRLKCRDFVFDLRIFAFSHGGSPGENTKKVAFRVFDLSPSGAHAHMAVLNMRSKDDSTQESSTNIRDV